MKLAKDANDVQWKKASKFKKLFVAAKQAINKKYASRAKLVWTKKQTES